MTHSVSYLFGVLVGIVCGTAVIYLLCRVLKKRFGGGKQEYDERQKLAQGNAYKLAYFTMLCYLAVVGIFDMATGIRWCDLYTCAFIGVILSVSVFAVSCIRHDAYFSYSVRPTYPLAVMGVIGLVNIAVGVVELSKPGAFFTDGMLNHNIINPLLGVLLLVLTVACYLRIRRTEKEEDA